MTRAVWSIRDAIEVYDTGTKLHKSVSICNIFLIKASIYVHTFLQIPLNSCERFAMNKAIVYLVLNQEQVFTWSSSTVLNLFKNTHLTVDGLLEKSWFVSPPTPTLPLTPTPSCLFLDFLHCLWLEGASFISSNYILDPKNVTEQKCRMWTSIV